MSQRKSVDTMPKQVKESFTKKWLLSKYNIKKNPRIRRESYGATKFGPRGDRKFHSGENGENIKEDEKH